MHSAGTREQAGGQLRERVESARRVAARVMDVLPEGKPAPWNVVLGIMLIQEGFRSEPEEGR